MGSPPMALPVAPGNLALLQLGQGLAPRPTPPLAAQCLWETENIPQRGENREGTRGAELAWKEAGYISSFIFLLLWTCQRMSLPHPG